MEKVHEQKFWSHSYSPDVLKGQLWVHQGDRRAWAAPDQLGHYFKSQLQSTYM